MYPYSWRYTVLLHNIGYSISPRISITVSNLYISNHLFHGCSSMADCLLPAMVEPATMSWINHHGSATVLRPVRPKILINQASWTTINHIYIHTYSLSIIITIFSDYPPLLALFIYKRNHHSPASSPCVPFNCMIRLDPRSKRQLVQTVVSGGSSLDVSVGVCGGEHELMAWARSWTTCCQY